MERWRYPDNWEEISIKIRGRANGACEWCGAKAGEPCHGRQGSKVVLTVHHIGIVRADGTPGDPHDKMDCRDANLVALCQHCHLMADLPDHMVRAKATRHRRAEERRAAAGQLPLLKTE